MNAVDLDEEFLDVTVFMTFEWIDPNLAWTVTEKEQSKTSDEPQQESEESEESESSPTEPSPTEPSPSIRSDTNLACSGGWRTYKVGEKNFCFSDVGWGFGHQAAYMCANHGAKVPLPAS